MKIEGFSYAEALDVVDVQPLARFITCAIVTENSDGDPTLIVAVVFERMESAQELLAEITGKEVTP